MGLQRVGYDSSDLVHTFRIENVKLSVNETIDKPPRNVITELAAGVGRGPLVPS